MNYQLSTALSVLVAYLIGAVPFAYVIVTILALAAAGADDPLPRGRMALPGVLHRGRYDAAAVEAALDAADEDMRSWAQRVNRERGGWEGRKVDEAKGWTERMARIWGRGSHAYTHRELLAPLRALGFGLER